MPPKLTNRLCRNQWLALQVYDFAQGGDVLPLHRHQAEFINHITIVTRGRFVVHGVQEGRVLTAGEVVEWPLGEEHGFEAIEAGSSLLNARIAWQSEIDPDYRAGMEGREPPIPEWLKPEKVSDT